MIRTTFKGVDLLTWWAITMAIGYTFIKDKQWRLLFVGMLVSVLMFWVIVHTYKRK